MDTFLFILIIVLIVFFITAGVLGISLHLSKSRLGVVFPKKGKGFIMYPSGFYDTKDIQLAGKDSIQTSDRKGIYHAHNGTSYKSRSGGPTIFVIDPVSEFAQNARVWHYILRLKSGVTIKLKGKLAAIRKFPTLNEAYLWYYENCYIPEHVENAPTGWKDNELKRVRAAKGVLAARNTGEQEPTEDATDYSNLPHPDAMQSTVQVQRPPIQVPQEAYPTRPMSDPEFERLILDIAQCLITENDKILPVYFDGEALTLNDIARWMHSPAPENTLKGEYDRGYQDGRQDQKKEGNDLIKYVIVFVMLIIGAGIAYTLFK